MARKSDDSAFLTAEQVLLRLAAIEQEGIAFYEGLAAGTKRDSVRNLAETLAKDERRHYNRFLAYAQRAEKSAAPSESALSAALPAEVVRLLQKPVFASRSRIERSAPYTSDHEALTMAIAVEQDTALLLTQLRQYVPKRQRRYVDRVIKEEWRHKERMEKELIKHFQA